MLLNNGSLLCHHLHEINKCTICSAERNQTVPLELGFTCCQPFGSHKNKLRHHSCLMIACYVGCTELSIWIDLHSVSQEDDSNGLSSKIGISIAIWPKVDLFVVKKENGLHTNTFTLG